MFEVEPGPADNGKRELGTAGSWASAAEPCEPDAWAIGPDPGPDERLDGPAHLADLVRHELAEPGPLGREHLLRIFDLWGIQYREWPLRQKAGFYLSIADGGPMVVLQPGSRAWHGFHELYHAILDRRNRRANPAEPEALRQEEADADRFAAFCVLTPQGWQGPPPPLRPSRTGPSLPYVELITWGDSWRRVLRYRREERKTRAWPSFLLRVVRVRRKREIRGWRGVPSAPAAVESPRNP